jgi:hypothetical protein
MFPSPPTNPTLLELPAGRWIKIHQQMPADAVTFERRSHAGSAFDSRSSQLVLFGSDEHGADWMNSPLIFDLVTLRWQRSYPNDDVSTYRVNGDGLAVAGPDGSHPWAMHTFGAVTYDPVADRVVVASYPGHSSPEQLTNGATDQWREMRHPTWLFDHRLLLLVAAPPSEAVAVWALRLRPEGSFFRLFASSADPGQFEEGSGVQESRRMQSDVSSRTFHAL